MKRRKEVGKIDIENPKCKWHKTVYLENGKLMKTIHDGSFTPVEPEPEILPMYFDNLVLNTQVGIVSTLETVPDFEWSWDRKEWHQWQYTTIDGVHKFDEKLMYSVGERLFIRGNNPNGLGAMVEGQETPNFTNFVITGSVSAGGNIMSLLDKTMELTEVPDYGFVYLFAIMGEDVEPVLLTPPSMDTITTIGEGGCGGMYYGCTFNMSNDGTTLNFDFPTPPITAGETTFSTAYDVANWMGNTNGFGGDNQ